MARDPNALELRADPAALAPECLLVFEIRAAINTLSAAVAKIQGLELIDEEELESDEADSNPIAYLMVPDSRALQYILSLWNRWNSGQELPEGFTPWRDVFACLRDLRRWGPNDRIQPRDSDILSEEIAGQPHDRLIRLEVELVFRAAPQRAQSCEDDVVQAITNSGGRIVSRARIPEIAYHAVLADLFVAAVSRIIERRPDSIAGLEPVMHIRPQSLATSVDIGEPSPCTAPGETHPAPDPILALIDGVPVANQPFIARHVIVDDVFELESGALVSQRVHGTAMASLIINGDRNAQERVLPRRIHVLPVLGGGDAFPPDRLIIDLIYRAIMHMRDGPNPSAPHVLIVNVSLGNRRRPFYGQMSPWARLLDRLAYRYGILFLVSAGNVTNEFSIPAFPNRIAFEDANPETRAEAVIAAIGNVIADRRLLTPSETINGVTVGAANHDWVPGRRQAQINVDPFPHLRAPNPSSALGPGFAKAVKPDILMPGAREHLNVVLNDGHIRVSPARASRAAGLKVAAPPRNGIEAAEGYTNGTSAATALASRTAHQIHDALEFAYGIGFLELPARQRAVLLKALLVHPAKWPDETADLIKHVLGPVDGRQHVRQKDNIRRFLGYGMVNSEDAVACAGDRATFWATGSLGRELATTIQVPIPVAMNGRAQPHSIAATLAWFTPVSPGRKAYRTVRLSLLKSDSLDILGVASHGRQPDENQSKRGTVITRCWSGDRVPAVTPQMNLSLTIQREPNSGLPIDDNVPFGLAVTICMPGVIELYEQARQRLGVAPRIPLAR